MAARAFSLIELVIVIAILAVITAIAVPRFTAAADRAAFRAQHAAFRQIEVALELYYQDNGEWPPNTPILVTPPGLVPYLHGDIFAVKTPIGSNWDWNGPGSSVDEHGYNIAIKGTVLTNDEWLEFDAMFDDGSLSTGLYRKDGQWLVRPVYAPSD
ncbi:MAG: type II secretion system protein [Planctomycetota bacterium]